MYYYISYGFCLIIFNETLPLANESNNNLEESESLENFKRIRQLEN